MAELELLSRAPARCRRELKVITVQDYFERQGLDPERVAGYRGLFFCKRPPSPYVGQATEEVLHLARRAGSRGRRLGGR